MGGTEYPEGSSPRGRGKPLFERCTRLPLGLIPARAGKTAFMFIAVVLTRAHPRAGGENNLSKEIEVIGLGSSPRGRGKPLRGAGLGAVSRLIPARAGKTRPCNP